jgi:TonB family protein
VSVRNAYLVSSVGHAGVLALGFALASLVRGPVIVPGVTIVLGGSGAPAGGPKKAEVRAGPKPTPPAVKPEPKPKPEVEPPPPKTKPVDKAPPQRLAPKPADVRGTKPPRDAGIVSKAPSEVAAATTARAEDSAASRATGTAGAGSGRGGHGEVGIEAEGEAGPAAGYLSLLRERVANAWEPPVSIERNGEARTVVVFTVTKSGGMPEGLAVQTSSGVSLFDRRAMAAVADAAPLPPIPAHLGYGSIVIRFTFTQAY